MELIVLRLLFDFGLVVLIWLVQLVIYPSMEYFQNKDLIKWHKVYTKKISYAVVPLMTGQLIISVLQLYQEISIYTIGSLLAILLLWGLTFLLFVPLHTSILPGKIHKNTTRSLVVKNQVRTALWTAVFLASLLHFID